MSYIPDLPSQPDPLSKINPFAEADLLLSVGRPVEAMDALERARAAVGSLDMGAILDYGANGLDAAMIDQNGRRASPSLEP